MTPSEFEWFANRIMDIKLVLIVIAFILFWILMLVFVKTVREK